jgi:lipoprotein-anchoring transpeptidase ErfK/SrfK
VPASDVSVYPVHTRIEVDLSERRVSVYRWGSLAFTTLVAVGASSTPTPVGRFYVDERFRLASADGPFGVAALGISAHSDALKDWVQGGPVALHGTDDPSSIGRPVSHGCVRLPNAVMTRLFAIAPAGTPVLIQR